MTRRKRKPNRRRTSKDIPAKGRLRDMADDLWALAVKIDWAGKCAVCGSQKGESHHLIPRQHQATRYLLRNGIYLCATHHQFDPNISPHQNAAGWIQWLRGHYPGFYQWYLADPMPKRFEGIVNPGYYCDVILSLKPYVGEDDYVRIVGQKFSAWLESQE